MAELQSVTNPQEIIEVADKEKYNLFFDEYVAFVAVGGLITGDDGSFEKMTVTTFANKIGVSRMSLNRWKKQPGFWKLVEKKRDEIFTHNRITAVWNGLFLRAAKGDAEQAKIILGHYAGWQPPSQRHDVQVTTGLADLVNAKRTMIASKTKVIDVPEPNAAANGNTTSA